MWKASAAVWATPSEDHYTRNGKCYTAYYDERHSCIKFWPPITKKGHLKGKVRLKWALSCIWLCITQYWILEPFSVSHDFRGRSFSLYFLQHLPHGHWTYQLLSGKHAWGKATNAISFHYNYHWGALGQGSSSCTNRAAQPAARCLPSSPKV